MAEHTESAASSEPASFLVPRVGEVLAGKYFIESELGRGGMGIVFAATNQLTSRRVAIKWMLPGISRDRSGLDRFLREAQIAGSIDHPNVVTIYDVGFQGDAAFIVMERLQGESLSALIRRRGILPLAEALAVLVPAMRGVEAAHARSVVHRDLKPDNIFICQRTGEGRPHVKVLDFGVSKLLADSGVQPITETGGLIGTPHYMAPEQASEAKHLDARVDVYAFGVILYEALTGQRPFVGDNYFELLLKIGTGGARPVRELQPGLPREVEQVISSAMAHDRERRYPTLAALLAALQSVETMVNALGHAPTLSGETPPNVPLGGPRARRWRIAMRWAVAAAGVLGAAMVLGSLPKRDRATESVAVVQPAVIVPNPRPEPVAPAARPPEVSVTAGAPALPPPQLAPAPDRTPKLPDGRARRRKLKIADPPVADLPLLGSNNSLILPPIPRRQTTPKPEAAP